MIQGENSILNLETNKYPYVIFYRLDKYSVVDSFLLTHKDQLNCSLFIINDCKQLNYLFNSSYQILITYGAEETEYYPLVGSVIAERMRSRWIHMKEITNLDALNNLNQYVNYCFIDNCLKARLNVRPVFSLFTTTYNSYEKIVRCYNSIKNQILLDWEWVIVDDSPDDKHFDYLKNLTLKDQRVRLYRRAENSGNIGNVKNEAVSLSRGKYVLEMDHDDELVPSTLSTCAQYFDEHTDVGFIYMNYSNIYENGENYNYGDFFCKGYGSYYCEKYNNRWLYVSNTPNINNITLSHLTCCPNHPRIWKKDVLLECGNYCEFLPICDDYEIILRTALHKTKMAKISKLGYIQYMNQSNNNFSLIRNSEINRIGPQYISNIYYEHHKINEKMKEKNAHEDEKYIHDCSQLWKREKTHFQHKFCNIVANTDYERQYCFIGIDSLIKNIDQVKELYKNPKNDFLLLENKASIQYTWWKLEYYGFDRFKCYCLPDADNQELIDYFMIMYKSVPDDQYVIFNNNVNKIKYNTNYSERFEVINGLTKPAEHYLEIGVETGFTYSRVHFHSKQGVDPDPKFSDPTLIEKTSDNYFAENSSTKDVIFIDGMHQVEYVVKDINNSIKILNRNGKLFLDDILPLTYDEQCKIPKKHFYENGILKYGESWTGDVWKVVYYLLLNYKDCIIGFSYYYHENYRGVACITFQKTFQIPEEDIQVINAFDYYLHFNHYISLLHS
jgi:glycosyltransferase involved in cell wall biosynthesis